MSWSDIQLFLAVAATGSLSAAPARRLAEEAGELERCAAGADTRPSGIVRISAAPGVAFDWLAPLAARVRDVLPEIRLEINATVAYVDLARREADLALRFDRPPARDLVALAKLDDRVGVFATSAYAAKLPRRYGVSDLDWIAWPPSHAHLPPNPQLSARIPGFRPVFASDDFLVQLRAAEAGVGAIVLGQWRSKNALPTTLVPLTLDLGTFRTTAYLVCAKSALSITRVRAVADLLVADMAAR